MLPFLSFSNSFDPSIQDLPSQAHFRPLCTFVEKPEQIFILFWWRPLPGMMKISEFPARHWITTVNSGKCWVLLESIFPAKCFDLPPVRWHHLDKRSKMPPDYKNSIFSDFYMAVTLNGRGKKTFHDIDFVKCHIRFRLLVQQQLTCSDRNLPDKSSNYCTTQHLVSWKNNNDSLWIEALYLFCHQTGVVIMFTCTAYYSYAQIFSFPVQSYFFPCASIHAAKNQSIDWKMPSSPTRGGT